MITFLERLLLLLLLALDWAAGPALLAPAVQPLAKRWRGTENVCPSGGYQQAILQECRPDLGTARPGTAADTISPESAPLPEEVQLSSAFHKINHLYVFLSLQR
jgi:hypothetical protein